MNTTKLFCKAISKSFLWTISSLICMVAATYIVIFGGLGLYVLSSGKINGIVLDGIDAMMVLKDMTIMSYFNGDFLYWVSLMSKEDISAISKLMILIMTVSYGMFTVLCCIHAYVKKDMIHKPNTKSVLKYIAIITGANFVLDLFIVIASAIFPGSAGASLKMSTALATSGGPVLTILSTGILAPIVEEICFRRGLQKNLTKINPTFAIIFTSLAFGILHGNILQDIFAFSMGLILGYVYYKTDNLLYPIVMHVVVNISGCFIAFMEYHILQEIVLYVIIYLIFCFTYFVYVLKTEGELIIFKKKIVDHIIY